MKNVNLERPNKKLDWRNLPYTVTEVIGPLSYRLDTPPGIHNVFHATLLRKIGTDPFPSQILNATEPPAIISDPENPEHQMDEILTVKGPQNNRKALVLWTGFTELIWEPLKEVKDLKVMDEFEAKFGQIT